MPVPSPFGRPLNVPQEEDGGGPWVVVSVAAQILTGPPVCVCCLPWRRLSCRPVPRREVLASGSKRGGGAPPAAPPEMTRIQRGFVRRKFLEHQPPDRGAEARLDHGGLSGHRRGGLYRLSPGRGPGGARARGARVRQPQYRLAG